MTFTPEDFKHLTFDPTPGDATATAAMGTKAPSTPLSELFDEAETQAFAKLKIHTIQDFLTYWPRKWNERGEYADIDECLDGEIITTGFTVEHATMKPLPSNPRRKMLIVHGVTDHDRDLSMTLFNAWTAKDDMVPGAHMTVSGELGTYKGTRQLKKVEYDLDGDLLDRPMRTVYPGKAKVTPVWIEKRNAAILDPCAPLPEHLPETIRQAHGFPDYDTAVRRMHLPTTPQEALDAKARLTYDEALATQLALVSRRAGAHGDLSRPYPRRTKHEGFLDAYEKLLPYELTPGQREAGERIREALAQTTPMNALLLGDVGSGKTTVATRAILQVVDAGAQGAFIAPTAVLAEQHYNGLVSDLDGTGVVIDLLTGSMSAADQKAARARLKDGTTHIIVGTHAVLSTKTKFSCLGLVVVDEQHRFGVEQRNTLRDRYEITPHMLVMTATPIPQTIAMTVYGDLDTYELHGIPAGRKPIKSVVVPLQKEVWVERIWEVFADQITHGHQIFLVGHLINRSGDEKPTAEEGGGDYAPEEGPERPPSSTVYELADLARQKLPHARVGVLHGKMDAEDKQRIMAQYAAGELDILVSTTVIEVGVNVPNATIMAIWDADRFGAAQLHQLRGRVGRGQYDGLCLLVTSAPEDHPSRERLDAVASTLDGYEIAQLDLEQRREGDVLGSDQSGKTRMRLLNLSTGERVIRSARADAETILAGDPTLRHHPGLVAWLNTMLTPDELAACPWSTTKP